MAVELPAFHRRTSTRVTAAVGMTACLLVGAATFLSAKQTTSALESAQSYHLSTLAQLMVDNVRAPVAFEEHKMVQDSLQTLAPSLPGVLWVEVTAKNGARIGVWERIDGLRARAKPDSVAKSTLPVINEGEVLALVEVAISTDGITEAYHRLKWIALLILGITVLITLIMSLILGRYQLGLEKHVMVKTAQVDKAAEAIFTVDAKGQISAGFSASCRALFEADDIAGMKVGELLGLSLEGWLSTVIGADELQWKLSRSHPPKEVRHRDRTLELSYSPIFDGKTVDRVMFVCRDVTEVRNLTNALDRVTQMASVDGELLGAFLEESGERLAVMREQLTGPPSPSAIAALLRNLHTLKGNSRSYGLRALAQQAHRTESLLQDMRDGGPDVWVRVAEDVEKIEELVNEFYRLGRDVLKKSLIGSRDGSKEEVMVAVSTLVPRLKNVAKDVAEQLGKPAPAWRTSLDDAMVDAPVLEKLGGVLTHLVRNAVDHGIELPAGRRMAQKEDRGHLALDATVRGDRLCIELRDDGRGIDLAKIRKIAIDRKLLSKEDPALMNDDAAMSLLFEPGFSTAGNVTEISGRGVGLDVVRTWIEELGGEVGIRSHAGNGTAFTVSLPLSASRQET